MKEKSSQQLEEQQLDTTVENFKMPKMNRRGHRLNLKMQGFLNYKNRLPIYERMRIGKENIEAGKKRHEELINERAEIRHDLLQSIESSRINTWRELGYNESEIEMLKEANAIRMYTTSETYREDKKEIRDLQNKALESRKNRNSTNS